MGFKQCYFVLFSLLVLRSQLSSEYNLNNAEEVEKYINNLTDMFEKDPASTQFCDVVHPSASVAGKVQRDFLLPKVLLWSPQEQHAAGTMKCPIHTDVILRPWQWTNNLDGNKEQRPRLIYDLFGNIILVQRIYLCQQRRKTHKLFAASPDVLNSLPETARELFPVKLYQRSGCSKRLISYIKNLVTQGVNFLKISEGIAALNHEHHTRLGEIFNAAVRDGLAESAAFDFEDFYSNDLFSFPSNDQITRILLDDFKWYKGFYASQMFGNSATSFSCDHTFKISKNIGVVAEGEEQKFITNFKNLFIVLNENGQILDWRLTKSTTFKEIDDLRVRLKDRLSKKKHSISLIAIDDCCKNRNKYQSVFPKAQIKLDIFHACQRVLRTLETGQSVLRNQFVKEFGLVFRQSTDLGENRRMVTPDPLEIEANLDRLLERWSNVPSSCLTEATIKQIANIREHIKKGCLSGIPPGFGTERNEQLHRLLNRSLLTGATRISLELAVALLTMLFYSYSSKASSCLQHQCNSKIKCVKPARKPIPTDNDLSSSWSAFKTKACNNTEEKVCDKGSQTHTVTGNGLDYLLIAESIEDVCSETVAESVLKAAISASRIMTSLCNDNVNRSFFPGDLLLIADKPKSLSVHHILYDNESDKTNPAITEHRTRLDRNLAGFNLKIDAIAKDGDCAFRSVVRMLRSTFSSEDQEIWQHLTTLGLLKNEDEDIKTLRNLFADEILKENDEFIVFVSDEDQDSLALKAEEFRQNGVFDRSLGDLVIKVCAHILKLPIMVVTSNENCRYVPFLPDDAKTSRCIYVAFHYYGAGHYDATTALKGQYI